jgi:hypothetical protein
MTCGTHEPAASTFQSRHEIERKKASDQISGAKDNPRKETLLYMENDMRVPFCSSVPNVSNAAWDQKKKESSQKLGG